MPLGPALRLLVIVEIPRDPLGGAVEDVDDRPEQIVEVGLEAGVAQGDDQGIEDVGDRSRDRIAVGERPRIGLVGEGAVAIELKLRQDVVGRRGSLGRSWSSCSLMGCSAAGPRPSRPSWRRSRQAGRTGTRSGSAGPKRSGGPQGPAILPRDGKALSTPCGLAAWMERPPENSRPQGCPAGPFDGRSPSRRPRRGPPAEASIRAMRSAASRHPHPRSG